MHMAVEMTEYMLQSLQRCIKLEIIPHPLLGSLYTPEAKLILPTEIHGNHGYLSSPRGDRIRYQTFFFVESA